MVAPDEGAVKNNFRIARKLGCPCASIFKHRIDANKIDTMKLIGEVKNKVVILVDDIIDTAGTACTASKLLKKEGAKEIYFFACHGLLSGKAIENINNSEFTKLIITNTLPNNKEIYDNPLIDIIDVSWLCSQAIKRQIEGLSLIDLYNEDIFNRLDSKLVLL